MLPDQTREIRPVDYRFTIGITRKVILRVVSHNIRSDTIPRNQTEFNRKNGFPPNNQIFCLTWADNYPILVLSRSSDRIKEEHSRSRTHSGLGPVCLVNDLVAIARTVAASVLMTGALVLPSSTSKTSACSRSFAQTKTRFSHASGVATVPLSSVHQASPSSEPA